MYMKIKEYWKLEKTHNTVLQLCFLTMLAHNIGNLYAYLIFNYFFQMIFLLPFKNVMLYDS